MSVADLNRTMLVRYIEWLNAQRCADGRPWAISSRAAAYSALHQLLRWLERCRPDLVGSIEYPFSPFPGRGTDRPPRATLSARHLRAILRACEEDIARMRTARESAAAQRAADRDKPGTLGWVLEQLDRRFGGVIPDRREVERRGNYRLQAAVRRHGGAKQFEPVPLSARGVAAALLPGHLDPHRGQPGSHCRPRPRLSAVAAPARRPRVAGVVQGTRIPHPATHLRQHRRIRVLPRSSGTSWPGTNGCCHWRRRSSVIGCSSSRDSSRPT